MLSNFDLKSWSFRVFTCTRSAHLNPFTTFTAFWKSRKLPPPSRNWTKYTPWTLHEVGKVDGVWCDGKSWRFMAGETSICFQIICVEAWTLFWNTHDKSHQKSTFKRQLSNVKTWWGGGTCLSSAFWLRCSFFFVLRAGVWCWVAVHLADQQPPQGPQGDLVCDHAGVSINKFSHVLVLEMPGWGVICIIYIYMYIHTYV